LNPYELLLSLSILLLIGFLFGKLAEAVKLPEITGYILAGVLIGPYALSLIDMQAVESFEVITNVVLAIIAYQIGTELFFPKLRKNAGKIIAITLVHALFTVLVVLLGVLLFTGQTWLAFALAGMAVASAPAPVMAVIKKIRAKGIVKSTVVPIVGILDIVAVIMFGLLSSVAISLAGSQSLTVQTTLLTPLYEVGLSIAIGGMMGAILGMASRHLICKFTKNEQYIAYLSVGIAFIMAGVWIAHEFHLSMILLPLTMGLTFTNFIGKETFDLQTRALDNFEVPLIILFFTIAGLKLAPATLVQAGWIALLFILLRIVGKVFGSFIGSTLTRCPMKVRRYTGLCLLSQGGVTIGMLVAMSAKLPTEEAQIVQAIILASILVFEIIGPIFLKRSLEQAGESREWLNKET